MLHICVNEPKNMCQNSVISQTACCRMGSGGLSSEKIFNVTSSRASEYDILQNRKC